MNRTAINGNIVILPELTKREQAILSYIEKREIDLARRYRALGQKWQEAYENRNAIYRILHSVEYSK